ncbi:MAG: sensor histidine kinase [Nitrospirae bacterium]|nr:sensor histidine kinase [Nitrospirota bacterium]
MKISFSKRITNRLLFFPFLFILGMFAALACGFYFLVPQNPFEDYHRQHLMNLSSEKRLVVDTWFEQAKKNVEYLARNDVVKEAISINTFLATATDKRKKKAADAARGAIEAASLRLLDETVLSSPFKMAVLLLKDGSIVSSTQRELTGSNWSDRSFFSGAVAELKSPSVRTFYSIDSGMGFLAPVFDDKEGIIGLVYAVPNIDKLYRLLHIENPVYKTEKVEMIDREGNLILTQKGFPDKRMKYNVPKEGKGNAVELRDNIFFDVISLENAPFRLVGTIDNAEVGRPLLIVLVLCAVYAGVVLIIMLFKSAFSGPKLVSRPVEKLISATKIVTDGRLGDISLGKDFSGELLALRDAFESMVDELKTREAMQSESLNTAKAKVSCAPYEGLSDEFRGPLSDMAASADVLIMNEHQLGAKGREALNDMLSVSRSLLLYVDNLYDIAQLEQGRLAKVNEEFNLCELMSEIESYANGLKGTREIEVIADCREEFEHKILRTDRLMLKKILMNVVNNALINTRAGTVTILATEKLKDGTEYIELSVADTGKGFSNDEINNLIGDEALVQSPSGLGMARKMSEILGGNLAAESIAGKGSVFTVTVPVTSVGQIAAGQHE